MIFVLVAGWFTYKEMPREATPEVTLPYYIVSTFYQGASPSTVESLITIPIEDAVRGVSGIKKITSTSKQSISTTLIQFEDDIDQTAVLVDLQSAVDTARRDLPSDLKNDPLIWELNINDFPFHNALVSSSVLNQEELFEVANDYKDAVENVNGVLNATLSGSSNETVEIVVDPTRMSEYGITIQDVRTAITNANAAIPGGSVEIGEGSYRITVPNLITNPSDFERVPVAYRNGKFVYIADIGHVTFTYEDLESYSRNNLENVISIDIKSRQGVDIVDLTTRMNKVRDQFEADHNGDVEIITLYSTSKVIKLFISDLENSIITSLIVLMAVLVMFIGFSSSVFVGFAIPLALLMSMIALRLLGYHISPVLLGAMLIALGMLVDNAIVVVENIYRHLRLGKPRYDAVIASVEEVGWPIIASTATTVAAFFPLTFWPGLIGQFMSVFPSTIIVVLLSSLFIALTFNPLLCATFMKIPKSQVGDAKEWVVAQYYRKWIVVLLDNKKRVLLLVGIVFLSSFPIFAMGNRGVVFFPESSPDSVVVSIRTPQGSTIDVTNAIIEPIEEYAQKYLGDMSDNILTNVRANSATITVFLQDKEELAYDYTVIIDEMRRKFGRTPGARITVDITSSDGPPTTGGRPFNMRLTGSDNAALEEAVVQIEDKLATIAGAKDIDSDSESGIPQATIRVNQERATMLGFTSAMIASQINQIINPTELDTFRKDGDSYDINLVFPEEYYNDYTKLSNIILTNSKGVGVPISNVATIVLEAGEGALRREEYRRVVTVSSDIDRDANTVGGIITELTTYLDVNPLPLGVTYDFTGEQEDINEAAEFLGKALAVALMLIFIVLLAEFNSFRQSIIIVATIILALGGVLLGLGLMRGQFVATMTFLAIISLAGIVVNNGIIFIDYINQLRNRGMPLREAIIEGGATRLRPVILTAITAGITLLPFAFKFTIDFINLTYIYDSATAQLWQAMSQSILYGLIFSTMLTLLLLPVLYGLLEGDGWGKPLRLSGMVRDLMTGLVMGYIRLVRYAAPKMNMGSAMGGAIALVGFARHTMIPNAIKLLMFIMVGIPIMMKNKLIVMREKRRNHKRAAKITKKRYAKIQESVYRAMQAEFNKDEESLEYDLYHNDDPDKDPGK